MVRFAGLSRAAMAVLLVVAFAAVAAAADRRDPAATTSQSITAAHPAAAADVRSAARRPGALLPLYASFITLQALDLYSTTAALDHGAVEANPAMSGLTGNALAMAAVKGAGTAGVIYATEKLWKRNKAAAIGLMIGANSAMIWVVQHNYGLAR
jgi:hypothetical protein